VNQDLEAAIETTIAEDEALIEGMSAALSTLGGIGIEEFLRADSIANGQGSAGTISLLEYDFRRSELRLLEGHTLEQGILDSLTVEIGRNSAAAGLALKNHLALIGNRPGGQLIRLLVLSDKRLSVLLADLLTQDGLSGAEFRLLKQLICGLNLSEAAAHDSIGHETKRSQFKSLARKLGVRSQTELVARTVTQILLMTGRTGLADDSEEQAFAALIRAFIPSARTYQLPGDNGYVHRVVDIGPLQGRPVILLHSQVLPDIRKEDLKILEDRHLRLIVPLRNGALSPKARPLSVARHMDHACEAIDLTRKTFCGDRAHIIACISGSAYGIEYAARNADRVASFAFVGACVSPNRGKGTAGRLRHGLLSMAMRNWAVYSRVIEFYGDRIRRPEALEQLLFSIYRPSLPDLAVIRGEFSKPYCGDRITRFFSESVESIKHDFYHQAHPRWDAFPTKAFPAIFLHGNADFIHTIGDVKALAESWGAIAVTPIPGGGQLLYHQHFRPLIAKYIRFRNANHG
jgi:pimeloyl-ACP methyl ester carboxylesterase